MTAGQAFELKPAGMLALDVARTEAGLLLLDVDYRGQPKALIPSTAILAIRDGAVASRLARQGRRSSAASALAEERRRGPRRQIVGLEIDWSEVEAHLRKSRLAAGGAGRDIARGRARRPAAASRSDARRRRRGRRP